MKAFISYSHKDDTALERLHVHLKQLQRDGQMVSWTDEKITAGSKIDNAISKELLSSQLFLALVSPDYIFSNYCFEKEFTKALELQKEGKLIIVPIIVEPCDWLSTPLSTFKALPKDGKAVSEWNNPNTAYLDVVQNLRVLMNSDVEVTQASNISVSTNITMPSRNYRVKKDFDSIQKIDFVEQSFTEIKEKMISFLNEIVQVDDHIKYKLIKDDNHLFEVILVNRHKIGADSSLSISIPSESLDFNNSRNFMFSQAVNIAYSIKSSKKTFDNDFPNIFVFTFINFIY